MKKYILAAFAAVAVVFGGVVTVPTAAMAHTGDLIVTAECNTETWQYDLTAKLTTSNTKLQGSTKWRVGTSQFQGTPKSDANMDRGPIISNGAQTFTLGVISLPGTTTGYGPWVYAFTTWSDSYAKGSDGQLTKQLKGDCVKPFDGATKYTPTVSATCDAATFSHPAIKTGVGVANVFGVRYGANQAEAQAKPFSTYTPGETVTYAFADRYVNNDYYFELKVGYDGETLTNQIGQSSGISVACEREIPEKPTPIAGDEQRSSDPICVVPADGTEVYTVETRNWTEDWTFNTATWKWELDKRVYGEWVLADTVVDKNAECDPVVEEDPEPPVVEEPEKLVKTGGEGLSVLLAGGIVLVALGVTTLMLRRIFR